MKELYNGAIAVFRPKIYTEKSIILSFTRAENIALKFRTDRFLKIYFVLSLWTDDSAELFNSGLQIYSTRVEKRDSFALK